jgi:transposase
MAFTDVTDALWARLEPLLPRHEPDPAGGRPRADDRAALNVILFVLRTGVQWQAIRRSLFPVSGSTAWRRLAEWQHAGVWDALLAVLQAELQGADRIDWTRASLDAATIPAKRGGGAVGPNPTDRGRPGSKHHLLVDRRGLPLAAPDLTAANVADTTTLPTMLDRVRPIRGRRGRPRRRPRKLHADKGYDSRANRRACYQRGIVARIARKGIESSTRLGRYRWVVERTIAWLHRFRRLLVRYERRADIHQAFLTLAACLICWNFVVRGF